MFSTLIAWTICLASEARATPVMSVNEPFPQETPTFFTVTDGLPADDVRAVTLSADGTPIAATAGGLTRYADSAWQSMAGPGFDVTLLESAGAAIWAAGGADIARLAEGKWNTFRLPDGIHATAIVPWRDEAAVGTSSGICFIRGGQVVPTPRFNEPVLSLAPYGSILAIGTQDGLYLHSPDTDSDGGHLGPVYPYDSAYSWAPKKVAALASEGHSLWFGAMNGAGAMSNDVWKLFTGKEGLPFNEFTCAAPGEPGVVWFGTTRGAIRYDGIRWSYRAPKRWLPDDHVNDIAVGADGTAWIATPKGIARIERKKMTLAEKAGHFEQLIDERHTRMGFVVRCNLEKENDFSTARIDATDNDGLYTGMYGASQAFRYAATKDPQAKQRAQQAFKALKLLVDVTSIPGFPARAVLPTDSSPDPNQGMDAAFNRRMQLEDPFWKDILPRWPKSADGKYWWKCDTSSDEICGHYFFYAVYYDLVAETDEEKTEVASLVRAITDHIVDHGFCLVDHDGKPTRWANWSPAYVNSLRGWADRGLQAVEILSFLNVAYHITGDSKYTEAARMLRDNYAYHITAICGRAVFPPDFVVPWDNNLAFLSYYGLLKYENDPQLRAIYRMSLERNWLFVSRQNDPFFNFVYVAVSPDKDKPVYDQVRPDYVQPLKKACVTLQGTPLILLGWEMKNSHRLDVMLDVTPRQRPAYGWSVNGEALPIEERCHIRINSDHFDLDASRGGGLSEYEGTFYLLPYYLGLYYGFLK